MKRKSNVCVLSALIVFACVAPTIADENDRDNIVVVFDASGSMAEKMPRSNQSKMAVAKVALVTAMQNVPDNANVGIVVFSGRYNGPKPWVYPLGPIDRAKLNAAIKRPNPANKTPLGKYMKVATDVLLKQRLKQRGYGTFRLLIVTDGQATDGNLVARYLPDILSRGITVDVIGVAMKSKHALATKVHSYRRGDDPDALVKAVTEVVGEVGASADDSTNAEHFDLIAGLPDGVAPLMLTALGQSGNHPIGQKPKVHAPEPEPAKQVNAGSHTHTPPPVPPTTGTAPTTTDGPGFGKTIMRYGIIVIVIFVVLKGMMKKKGYR